MESIFLISRYYEEETEFFQALTYMKHALDISLNKNSNSIAEIYFKLGKLHEKTFDFNLALLHYKQCQAYDPAFKDI